MRRVFPWARYLHWRAWGPCPQGPTAAWWGRWVSRTGAKSCWSFPGWPWLRFMKTLAQEVLFLCKWVCLCPKWNCDGLMERAGFYSPWSDHFLGNIVSRYLPCTPVDDIRIVTIQNSGVFHRGREWPEVGVSEET